MNKKAINDLFNLLDNIYPNKFNFPKRTEQESEKMIDDWYIFLKEHPKNQVFEVVKALISKKDKWPPNAAEIIQEIKSKESESTYFRI